MSKARFRISQGDVWWINLDPTIGREISERRPCLVVSPNEMNAHLGTVIVAPVTSTQKPWPTRVPLDLNRKTGSFAALDQLRAVDQSRLVRRAKQVDVAPVLAVLREMFASR